MAYLKAELFEGTESCSRCQKPMNDSANNPGMILREFTPENGRVQIWAHVDCVQQLLYKVRRGQISTGMERLSHKEQKP